MSNDVVEVELQPVEMSNDGIIIEVGSLGPEIQPLDDSHEIQLLDDSHEWLVEIENRLQILDISHSARPSMDSNSSNSSKSEELPSIIGNWQCWDDFRVSFFPETQMWQLVACIMHWFRVDLRSYCGYMQDHVDLAWSYYLGVNEKFRAENRKHFIQHLLVNGCFLIFAMILISVQKDPVGKKDQKNILDEIISRGNLPMGLRRKDIKNIINLLFQDPKQVQLYMLTINYQIPWFVLEAMYNDLSFIGTLLDTPILKFALSCFPTHSIIHASKDDHGTIPDGGFKHLLHIFHWSRTPDGKYLADNSVTTKWIGQFHIPSAIDLQLSLTFFKKYPKGSFHVSYSDNGIFSGEMQLTPWYLSQPNTKIYESLLRFEQVYGASCGFSFTAYVTCMACLLITENDVKVLRENGIITNTRFGDNDVLLCVQHLQTLILDNQKIPDELIILEKEVMTRYQRSAYRVYGDFKRRYCSNPWITISVIGAILISVFGLIQTIYAVLGHYQKIKQAPN